MCGIAGVVMFDGASEPAAQAATRMVSALRHRGPDDSGVWDAVSNAGAAVAFGHTRLSILDLSAAGHQPMTRERAAITYNGEIYNYQALRAQLSDRGVTFASKSDTEVLLAACLAWGDEALVRLDGMFAFGLWDGPRDRLVLARDRFGIKPLYYYQDDRAFVFASEVRALLASGLVPASLDPDGLWHYLGYQTTPTPKTLLRGIHMLEPGHAMVVSPDRRTTKRRYWDLLAAAAAAPEAVDGRVMEQVGNLVTAAVTSHLVSDVPVGLFLSGGIDSGALVSAVASAGLAPHTFTVGLDERAFDESAEAAQVAKRFRSEHTEVRLRASDLLDELPAVLASMDHPSGDGVNSYVVSRAVRDRGVKVALSGLGGDEIFGGYPSFRRLGRLAPVMRHWRRSPRLLRKAAASAVRVAGAGSVAATKAAAVVEADGSLARAWPVTRQLFPARERRRLLEGGPWAAAAHGDDYVALLDDAFAGAPEAALWSRISFAEARTYMHDVLLRDTDQMSMAHGLEVRVPFLDHRLASYVVSLPDRLKDGHAPKSLLVDSLLAPLPDRTVRQRKRGFTLPFDLWMRGPLRSFCEAHLGERGLDGRGMLGPGQGARLWRQFLDRTPGVTWARVWTLVALEAWLERCGVEVRP